MHYLGSESSGRTRRTDTWRALRSAWSPKHPRTTGKYWRYWQCLLCWFFFCLVAPVRIDNIYRVCRSKRSDFCCVNPTGSVRRLFLFILLYFPFEHVPKHHPTNAYRGFPQTFRQAIFSTQLWSIFRDDVRAEEGGASGGECWEEQAQLFCACVERARHSGRNTAAATPGESNSCQVGDNGHGYAFIYFL